MQQMYIDISLKCPGSMRIWLPHLEEPLKAKKVAKEYPEFAAMFDGSAKENTLLFYYRVNKTEYCLDFIDEEAEEEVAELMGVNIPEIVIKDDEEPVAKNALTKEDIGMFRSYIDDIRKGLDLIHTRPPEKD